MSALRLDDRDYDLDSWRLADVEGGGHVLQLGLGWSFMIYAFAVWDGKPTEWTLIQTDCAVAHVEQEVVSRGRPFACAPRTLPLPEAGPPLTLLNGPRVGEFRVTQAHLQAQPLPFRWELQLRLAKPSSAAEQVTLSFRAGQAQPAGWRLLNADGTTLTESATFTCGFRVWGSGKGTRWGEVPVV